MFLIFVGQGCLKDEPLPAETSKKDFIIKVFYTTVNELDTEYPDMGANVYIYYRPMSEMTYTEYIGYGQFRSLKDSSIIVHEQKYQIPADGIVSIIPMYEDRVITYYVESNYYEKRLSSSAKPGCDRSFTDKIIFNP